MPETHLSLSWEAYQNNICRGLSLLQQRGEFVDMTLAADGHHVKVHQMVLSLVSPYIKDLISTAQCPHPVIFLNNISYKTLCSILEYVYTGEVLVPEEHLPDIVAAGRALHIKGLQELDDTRTSQNNYSILQLGDSDDPISIDNLGENKKLRKIKGVETLLQPTCKVLVDGSPPKGETDEEYSKTQHTGANQNEHSLKSASEYIISQDLKNRELSKTNTVQYSLSTQGGIQIIVNRYIYTLKYVQKKRLGFWRCADCANKKCRAIIHTNEKKQVIKRTFTHNHPYHDDKIVKKQQQGIIFSTYDEAETIAQKKKMDREKTKLRPLQPSKQETDSD